jgi:transcriptional regulator with XRE-family HTH domain
MLEYDKKKLGTVFREARVNRGISQREVAEMVGYSSSQFISNVERGASVASLVLMAKLIRIYKISPERVVNLILESQKQLLHKKFKV